MPLLIISSLIILDQLSKYLVRQWGGFYICNPAIAFGLHVPQLFFWSIWLTVIAYLGLSILNFKFSILNQSSISKFLISKSFEFEAFLIIGGALSNIIDRLYFGCVIDIINIPFWPAIFNLADVFIVIGAIIILFKIRTTD